MKIVLHYRNILCDESYSVKMLVAVRWFDISISVAIAVEIDQMVWWFLCRRFAKGSKSQSTSTCAPIVSRCESKSYERHSRLRGTTRFSTAVVDPQDLLVVPWACRCSTSRRLIRSSRIPWNYKWFETNIIERRPTNEWMTEFIGDNDFAFHLKVVGKCKLN